MLSIPALSLSFSFSVLHDPTFKTAPPSPPSCSRAHLPLMPIVLSSLSQFILLSALASLSLPPLTVCVCVSFSQSLSTEPPESCSQLLCHFLFATHLLVHK